MSLKSLQTIAGEWHSGQNTALYAYASTGTIPQYRQHARNHEKQTNLTQAAAEAACKIWEDGGHKVSPIVRMTGGAS